MKRREFITLLGGAAVAWPLSVRAQQVGKIYRIGVLETISATLNAANLDAFRGGLREPQADCGAIADRLIERLPRRSTSSKVSLADKAQGVREMTRSAVANMIICAALGVTVLIIAASREPSSRGDHADVPAFSTASPPQTSQPSSGR